jgi:glycerol-3-phosphate acyltransferase PlsY
MKIQDLLFFALYILLIFRQDIRFFVGAGLVCLALSIPLFALWIFFTAERLTWYAGLYFLGAVIFFLHKDNINRLLRLVERLINTLNNR